MTKGTKAKHNPSGAVLGEPTANSRVTALGLPSDANNYNHQNILNSWKEIAAYLGKSVRTVQRMEVELGLPVRRPKGHARSSVMALTTELDQWLKSFIPQRADGFSSARRNSITLGQDVRGRVLVIDDKEVTLYAMSRYLRSFGYDVATAQSGREALKNVLDSVDVVLLDMNLPDVHGLEVLRRIRTSLSTSHIPVICTSATYAAEGIAPVALQLGAKRFLMHPISPEVLHQAIREFLPFEPIENAPKSGGAGVMS